MEQAIVGGGSGGFINSANMSGVLQAGDAGNFGGSGAKSYNTGTANRTMVLWYYEYSWWWVDSG